MSGFFDTTFGPAELKILDAALAQWCVEHQIDRQSEDAAIAAEILLNLFREGKNTLPALREGISRYQWPLAV